MSCRLCSFDAGEARRCSKPTCLLVCPMVFIQFEPGGLSRVEFWPSSCSDHLLSCPLAACRATSSHANICRLCQRAVCSNSALVRGVRWSLFTSGGSGASKNKCGMHAYSGTVVTDFEPFRAKLLRGSKKPLRKLFVSSPPLSEVLVNESFILKPARFEERTARTTGTGSTVMAA